MDIVSRPNIVYKRHCLDKGEKFLGKEFSVMSSFGHIRDLKEKEFSVDIEHNFQPIYVVPSDKKKLVGELKKAALLRRGVGAYDSENYQ